MKISIPTPCHEAWDAMTPAGRGRHCAACAKTVVDFTGLSDAAVQHLIDTADGALCGRFRPGQLDRPLARPTRSSWLGSLPGTGLRATLAAAGLAATATTLAGQTPAAPPADDRPTDTIPGPRAPTDTTAHTAERHLEGGHPDYPMIMGMVAPTQIRRLQTLDDAAPARVEPDAAAGGADDPSPPGTN